MTPVTYPPLYFSLYLLLGSAVASVVTLQGELTAQLSTLIFWASVYAAGLYCGWQNANRADPRYEQIMNAILVIALFIFISQLAVSGIEIAMVYLLMWLQAAKNFTLSHRRDLYFAFVVSFILLLYGAANSKSAGFIFYMAVYVLAGTFALVAAHIEERTRSAQGAEAVVIRSTRGFFSGVTTLSFVVITLATLLYLFVPRPDALQFGAFASDAGEYYENEAWEEEMKSGPRGERGGEAEEDAQPAGDADTPAQPAGQDRKTDANSGAGGGRQDDQFRYHGFEQTMELAPPGEGGLSNELIIYVQASRPLYLRGAVFDTFESGTWHKSRRDNKKYRLDYRDLTFGEQHDDAISYSVTLATNFGNKIFAAARVERINFPGAMVAREIDGTLLAPAPLKEGTVYSVSSYIPLVANRPASGVESLENGARFLQLPEGQGNIQHLASSLTQGVASDLEKASKIEAFFRNEFEYTLDTVAAGNRPTIDEFLFTTRRGHCELFATSMVLMLRAIDIPARLATGFSATNLNPVTGFYEVRGMDAHAWVEAYFPAVGWVLFEPTSFYSLPDMQQPPATTGEAIIQYLETIAKSAEISAPDSYETLSLLAILASLKDIGHLLGVLWDVAKLVVSEVWLLIEIYSIYLVGAVAGLVAIFFILQMVRHPLLAYLSLWRLKRLGVTHPGEFMIRCFGEMERYFGRCGAPRVPGQSIGEYAAALAGRYQSYAEVIRSITGRAELALYSNKTLSGEDVKNSLSSFRALINASLYKL